MQKIYRDLTKTFLLLRSVLEHELGEDSDVVWFEHGPDSDCPEGQWKQDFADFWVPILVNAGILIKVGSSPKVVKEDYRVSWKGHCFMELYNDWDKMRQADDREESKVGAIGYKLRMFF